MTTHGDHHVLVDCDDHSDASQETESRSVAVADQSRTRSGTNDGSSVFDATSRPENVARDSKRKDQSILIGDRVDNFMNALIARAYATNERG